MLSQTTEIDAPITINLNDIKKINSIGIGNAKFGESIIYDGWFADAFYDDEIDGGTASTVYTDSINCGGAALAYFTVTFNDINNTSFTFEYIGSGLYMMPKTISASQLTITTNAEFIGRIGAGMGVHIPTSIAKEPAINSTSEPRITLSGQSVIGKGGYNYKTVSLDSRYKIDRYIMNEINDGYKYIGMGYPFFIDLTTESYKLPFSKLYANERNQRNMSFESGIKKYLYSRRFEFEERF
jgi:hypothetical protein